MESDEEPEAEDVHGDTLEAANRAAIGILANNRSVHGTTAARMAWDTTTAEAAPSWTGIGANYMAWVQALKQDPMSPEAAINEEAPERAYGRHERRHASVGASPPPPVEGTRRGAQLL
jgi:hypothetical protein